MTGATAMLPGLVTGLSLIIAIGAAALGLVLLLLYKQRFEAEASGGVPVRVLIAVQDIPLGAALSENMMGYRLIPQAYLEDRFIRYSDVRRIIGVRVSNGLRANLCHYWRRWQPRRGES